jgi:monoamine oxidase
MKNTYDLVIVGGGLAGMYSAYLASKKYPEKKILLLEKSGRFGGHIQTKYFCEDDKTVCKYETGGAVLYDQHKNMLKLAKELNVKMTTKELERDSKFVDLLKKVFRYMDTIKSNAGNYTFMNICRRVLKNEDVQYLVQHYGFYSEFYIADANIARNNIEKEILKSSKMYFFDNGYEEIIEKMKAVVENNGRITLATHCVVIHIINLPQKELELTYVTNKTQQHSLTTKMVHFAIPKEALLNIDGFEEYERDLLSSSVQGTSLCRIFAQYNTDNPKTSWLRKLGFTKTFTPIQMIIPIQKSRGVYQISYSDYENADYWGKMQASLLSSQIRKHLIQTFPSESSNIKYLRPLWMRRYYWKNAVHFWKPGTNPSKNHKEIIHLRTNVKIVGESFSLNQGWGEGAIQTVNHLYKSL